MKHSRLPRSSRREYRTAILAALLIPSPLPLLAQDADTAPAEDC